MSKTLQLFLGLILLILVPLWTLLISPELLKLPANISYKANLIHTENNRFDINSDWAGKSISISSSNLKTFTTVKDTSTLQSLFKVESLTGEVLFELNQNFKVNRYSRHNIPGGNDTDGEALVIFPPNVSKKPINFWSIEMGAPTVMTYVGNKTIQKINTYHFQVIDAEIDDTLGFEFLSLVPEKYKVFSKVNIDVYVEPVTGIVIDHQDSGVSYYTDKNMNSVWEIAQWSNKYNDPTIIERANEAKSTRTKYYLVSRTVPMSLGLLGILLIALSFRKKGKKSNPKRK